MGFNLAFNRVNYIELTAPEDDGAKNNNKIPEEGSSASKSI